MTTDTINDPAVQWFDSSTSWPWAIKRALFFAGYCGSGTVVRWQPTYHKWYVGFRKVATNGWPVGALRVVRLAKKVSEHISDPDWARYAELADRELLVEVDAELYELVKLLVPLPQGQLTRLPDWWPRPQEELE